MVCLGSSLSLIYVLTLVDPGLLSVLCYAGYLKEIGQIYRQSRNHSEYSAAAVSRNSVCGRERSEVFDVSASGSTLSFDGDVIP